MKIFILYQKVFKILNSSVEFEFLRDGNIMNFIKIFWIRSRGKDNRPIDKNRGKDKRDSRDRDRDRERERRLTREEREAAREKERGEALARCQERQRERERLAKSKEEEQRRKERSRRDDRGLDKPTGKNSILIKSLLINGIHRIKNLYFHILLKLFRYNYWPRGYLYCRFLESNSRTMFVFRLIWIPAISAEHVLGITVYCPCSWFVIFFCDS